MKSLIFSLGLFCTVLLCAANSFADECVDCHVKETPAAVEQWQGSDHAGRVGCASCHGTDHDAILRGDSPVTADVCGQCHEKAYLEHSASKHGMGLHAGWGCTRNLKQRDQRECRFCHEEGSTIPKTTVQCARFLTQSSEMGALGCNRCHQVESSCASCHTNHVTDLAAVRDPASCATCHMGPDHPQWEMWQTSRHGVLYGALGASVGPDCQRCHMPNGSHNVSFGITMSPAMLQDADSFTKKRAEMLSICSECHSQSFSERELHSGDTILDQSKKLVKEAESIIRDLSDRNLLVPSLAQRPEHPLRGRELVLDGQMLYEDISHIERLFFKMKKYDLAKTVKGAYHQNPAYTHWYGNAELKMTLADIKAESARLLASDTPVEKRQDGAGESDASQVEKDLQVLKRKHDRGALSDTEYSRRKYELLGLE